MPRKSLPSPAQTPFTESAPTRSQSTLKRTKTMAATPSRLSNIAFEVSTVPRARSSRKASRIEAEEIPAMAEAEEAGMQVKGATADTHAQEELEAWQDFAAEHYEMIEQLPLELHRNFRLLRELDDGCIAQRERLHAVVRLYIIQRLDAERFTPVGDDFGDGDVRMADSNPNEPTAMPDSVDVERVLAMPDGEAQQKAAVEMGPTVSDGAGGLILTATSGNYSSAESAAPDIQIEPRKSFPRPDDLEKNGESSSSVYTRLVGKGDTAAMGSRPWELLPEIARMAREIVRTGEEKLGLATGAYNLVDRHIRALDNALSTDETSILLGLRPSTLPSATVDQIINTAADQSAILQEDDGTITIGVAGRGSRKSRKRGKKQPAMVEAQVEVSVLTLEVDADPNEPRYCYCHQVSYGQMIGCENEECALEWFHLACVGLQVPPTGKWWCNNCKPKIGLGKGGAGTVPMAATGAARSLHGGRKK